MNYLLDYAFLPAWFWCLQGFLLGACIGSFLNVVMYRIPIGPVQRKQGRLFSINRPGSHCPSCQHPLAWYDNLPVIGWVVLRGKCRYCGVAIPFRYVGFEFLVGVMVAAGGYGFQLVGLLGMGLGLMWLIPVLVWTFKRVRWHRFMLGWTGGVLGVWLGFLMWAIHAQT